MIEVKIDKKQINRVQNALSSMQSQTPNVLKKAINETAKQARKEMAEKAKQNYALKTSGFNSSMRIKNATVGKLQADIITKGEALEIGKFKASPFRYTTGKNRPAYIKAKVLSQSQMKALVKSGVKAFVARFRNGHVAVAQRVPGKVMESNPKKTFLKKLLSPSIPQMIGNETKVYGEVEPRIQTLLQENIQRELIRTMGGGKE